MIPTCTRCQYLGDGWYECEFTNQERCAAVSIQALDSSRAQAKAVLVALPMLQDEVSIDDIIEAKFLEIDYGTDALVNQGFQYPPASGIRHSLTLEAQSRMNALFTLYNAHLSEKILMGLGQLAPGQTNLEKALPLKYNSIDDRQVVFLETPEQVAAFCMTAFGTMSAILNSGTQVKDALRALSNPTACQIAAFEDPRFA